MNWGPLHRLLVLFLAFLPILVVLFVFLYILHDIWGMAP